MDEQNERTANNPTPEKRRNDTNSHDHFLREMSRDIQLLATLVATATYVAGFNPPGGVWQVTGDAAAHLPGDPIMLSADYRRYMVFFYCNATAFASSLMVFVLLLVLTAHRNTAHRNKNIVRPLCILVVVGLLSFIVAYAAGTCRDTFATVYYSLLMAAGFITHVVLLGFTRWRPAGDPPDKPSRQVLMLFATFALTVTYVSGLSTPGGFWDNTEGGHRPGDAIRKDHHARRLTAFFVFNSTAFVASLLTIMVLLVRNQTTAYWCSILALIGLLGAYAAGICRETNFIVGWVVLSAAMALYVIVHLLVIATIRHITETLSKRNGLRQEVDQVNRTKQIRQASSLVQLLATLAVAITYQAGLDPPGGVWQENRDGHKAGDPILLTTNPRRYKAFFYCNSVAFVASLVAIILVQEGLKDSLVEATMMLELLGLIGAYATGSCRDANTSFYVMCIAGAAVVYVVLHVSNFALENTGNHGTEDDALVDRRGRRLLLFAILVANMTYQAGLTPPGGFLLQDEFGHHAGDPVLLYNYPRRYNAYFYCNSISFMVSIAQIVVLVNPVLYGPAVRSHALSICTVVSFICLMGAFAAGSTQHLITSIYIFVVLAVVFLSAILVYLVVEAPLKRAHKADELSVRANTAEAPLERADTAEAPLERADTADEPSDGVQKRIDDKRKQLMTLGILVAGVTYQAGLDPPGGSWQRSSDGHDAGNPVMRDNRRHQYLGFFYNNHISFMSSIFLIAFLLLPTWLQQNKWCARMINAMVVMEFFGILVAYAAGSSRQWKMSVYVGVLVIAVLAYVAIRVILEFLREKPRSCQQGPNSSEQGNQA